MEMTKSGNRMKTGGGKLEGSEGVQDTTVQTNICIVGIQGRQSEKGRENM